MTSPLFAYLAPIGRLLLASIFIMSSVGKLMDPTGTAGYMASGGLPASAGLAVVVGLFEFIVGFALLLGFQGRAAALALAVFTVVASLLFHQYWAVPADQYLVTLLLFQKNMAIVGALLFIGSVGAGSWSLDDRPRGVSLGHAGTSLE